jgi:hypothetical protein
VQWGRKNSKMGYEEIAHLRRMILPALIMLLCRSSFSSGVGSGREIFGDPWHAGFHARFEKLAASPFRLPKVEFGNNLFIQHKTR